MKKPMIVTALLVMAVCALAAPASLSASAASAPAYPAGADGSGVIVAEDNCLVSAVSEKLTFRIGDVPKESYSSAAEFLSYDASVTSSYTFFNPTQEALSVRCVFPMIRPAYAVVTENGKDAPIDDLSRYSVKTDGEAAETALRYTYAALEEGAFALPKNERKEDGFYHSDIKHRTHVLNVTCENKKNRFLEVVLSYNAARTKILLEDAYWFGLHDGDLRLVFYLGVPDPPRFESLGDMPVIKRTRVLEGPDRAAREAEASVQTETDEKSFAEYAASLCPADVGGLDWFNATAAYLEGSEHSEEAGVVNAVPSGLKRSDLMRWYEYTLEIPAGGTVQNEVTAPLYPAITETGYRYTYLLSSASGWADLGAFEAEILTDRTIEDCSLALQKTEEGYRYSREGLPLGELTFSIGGASSGKGNALGVFLRILTMLIFAVPLLLAVGIGVYFLVRARKKK